LRESQDKGGVINASKNTKTKRKIRINRRILKRGEIFKLIFWIFISLKVLKERIRKEIEKIKKKYKL
jgi:hypothetical protein